MVMHSTSTSVGRRSGLLSIFSQIQDFKRVLPQCGVVALVVAARVIREWGITVDKVMDLIEKKFSKERRHYKNGRRPQSLYHEK